MTEPLKSGWMWLINSPKWHYFDEGSVMSLCGRWMAKPVDLEQGNDKSPDNCQACLKKLLRKKAKVAK